MFADINCGNEMFWGHLGVRKRGLKKGKLTQKIITFSKKQKIQRCIQLQWLRNCLSNNDWFKTRQWDALCLRSYSLKRAIKGINQQNYP